MAVLRKIPRDVCSAERTQCPICEGSSTVVKSARGENDNQYCILQCDDCRLVYANLVGRHRKDHSYDEQFYSEGSCLCETNPYRLADEARVVQEVLNFLSPVLETGRMLDVGCGDGVHLKLFRDQGWEVYGTEVSEFAVQHAKDKWGTDVFRGLLEDITFPDEYFDFVQMRHVIEHLTDPVKSTCVVHRLLRPGGVVRIDTPTIGLSARVRLALYDRDTAIRRIMRRVTGRTGDLGVGLGYGDCHPPEHNFWFSQQAMRILLEERGFRILKIMATYRGNPLHYPSKQIVQQMNWKGRLEAILFTTIDRLGAVLNQGDILVVYAERT